MRNKDICKGKKIFESFIIVLSTIFLISSSIHFLYLKDYIPFGVLLASALLILSLMIFRDKLMLLSIAAFLVSTYIFLFHPTDPLALPIFSIGTHSLSTRGFYRKHKIIKITFTIIYYAVLLFSCIILHPDIVPKAMMIHLPLTFIFLSSAYITGIYIRQLMGDRKFHFLNLTEYPQISENDKLFIKKIFDGEKYEQIAVDLNMSLSSIKKHSRQIFELFECSDLISFITKYSRYEILYTEDDVLKYKNRMFSMRKLPEQ
ncbi:MAG: hypothetical protein IKX23_10335 [Treponema sp.]|nr:hypothetical protein [Treponema sp.]